MTAKEPILVRKNSLGYAVFASRNIRKWERICVMAGQKISPSQLNRVTNSSRNILVDPLQISDSEFINMRKPYVLVNHSCNPNAGIKEKNVLVAIKNIKKNDEILYDYSSVWYEGFRCRCESKNCRMFIGDFFTLPVSAQKKYIRLGIVPEFIKTKARIKMRKRR